MMRQLPDGTFLDTTTGYLMGSNGTMYGVPPTQTQLIRDTELRAKAARPIVNRGQQIETVAAIERPNKPTKVILQPRIASLAVDPYGTGINGGVGAMSDTSKRMLLMGLIVAAAAGAVYVKTRFGKKAKKD